jgi:hypothetical protein
VLARALAILLAIAIATMPRATFAADDDDAQRAAQKFVEGQRAFTAGDYRRAAEAFEGAYREKPHYAALWNAARSWHRAGEEVRAANRYADYLRDAPPDAPDRDQANASLRELTTVTARIELRGTGGVTRLRLDGQEIDSEMVFVAPGEHVAEADDEDGGPVRKLVRVEAGQLISVTLSPDADAVTADPSSPDDRDQAPDGRRSVDLGEGLPPAVAIAGGVLTLVGVGVTVVAGLDTVSKRDAFLEDRTQARLDDAFASQTRTNVLLATTLTVAVVTGVIAVFFTDWKGSETKAAGVRSPTRGWTF